MKKLLISLFILIALITPQHKAQALDPKAKAFMIISAYGTVGGALLGFASLAFGANSRAIAQGASLGLYAGIGFGAYVISSHGRPSSGYEDEGGYNDGYGDPYARPPGALDGNSGGGFGAPPPEQAPQEGGGGFFGGQRSLEIQDNLFTNYKLKNKKGAKLSAPIYVNLFHMSF